MDDPSDLTRASCCERDMEEQKKVLAWKSELKRLDPVENRINQQKFGGALASNPQTHIHHAPHTSNFSTKNGIFSEADECHLFHLIEEGSFFICLACPLECTELELVLRQNLDGFDSPMVVHRFRPDSQCRSGCFLSNTVLQLPALVVFQKGVPVTILERRRLESESETSLITRLGHLKHKAEAKQAAPKLEDEEENGPKYFQCGKSGCLRTFSHVHVKSKYKYDGKEEENSENDDDDDNKSL